MKRLYIYTIIFASALASCTSLDQPEGVVSIAIDENIAEPLSVSVETRSAATKAVTAEEIDLFLVDVGGTDISGTYASIKGQSYKLKVGTYTATAVSLPNANDAKSLNGGYGAPYYAGSTEFEVKALENTRNVEIKCKVANARVCLSLTDSFRDYYDVSKTYVSVCESESFALRELAMLPSDADMEAYYTAGDPVYIKLTTSKIGSDTSVTYVFRSIAAVAACTSYNVLLSVDPSSVTGGITFTVAGSDMTTNDLLSVESYKAPSAPPVADL